MVLMPLKFIADQNVGSLAKWLRMIGFDTILFTGENDAEMVHTALVKRRTILTRDTGIMARRLVAASEVNAVLIRSERLADQVQQVVAVLKLDRHFFRPFSRCMEDNQELQPRPKAELKDRVPPYVYQTQEQFRECPACHRIYWQGSHWHNMQRQIAALLPIGEISGPPFPPPEKVA